MITQGGLKGSAYANTVQAALLLVTIITIIIKVSVLVFDSLNMAHYTTCSHHSFELSYYGYDDRLKTHQKDPVQVKCKLAISWDI